MQVKLKATIIMVHEYEADTNIYNVNTVEEMCKMDEELFNDEPNIVMDLAKMSVKVEKVPNV